MVASRIAARGWWLGVGAVCLLFLLFWTQLAFSSRLATDDFCAAGLFKQNGLIRTVFWWRAHQTGRWFSQGLVAWVTYCFLPTGRTAIYAFGLFGALWASGIWAWRGIGTQANNRASLAKAALLVLFLLAAAFALTPTPSEVWFWVAGSGVHCAPVVALFVIAGVLARGQFTVPLLCLGIVASIVLGGCSETGIVLGVLGLGCGALKWQNEQRRLAIVCLVALLCSAAFALSAPGNFLRLQSQTGHSSLQPHDIIKAVVVVVRAGFLQKLHWWLLFCGMWAAFAPQLSEHFPRIPRRLGFAFWAGVPLACALSLTPAVIAFHGPFPLRTLAPVTFTATIWASGASVQFGLWCVAINRNRSLPLQLGGLLCAFALVFFWGNWMRKQPPIVSRAARTFDRNYVLIRAQRPDCKTVLRVEKPIWQRWVPIGVPEVLPTNWISRCMSGSLDSCPLAQK